jgi:hypothetical protein
MAIDRGRQVVLLIKRSSPYSLPPSGCRREGRRHLGFYCPMLVLINGLTMSTIRTRSGRVRASIFTIAARR